MKERATILAVDDAEVNVDILCGILKKYDVIPALSGADAIELAQSEDIDLILLDILMPDIDGYEVFHILKNSEKTKDTPIIFITAKTSEVDIIRGFEMGAVDYVTKPFNPVELLARVNTHIELQTYRRKLEDRVREEVDKNRQKDELMYQQSKQAALGELLMNIAHQWKQPLNALFISNDYIKDLLDNGELDTKEMRFTVNKVNEVLEFMLKTLDTFQKFYTPNVSKADFSITEAIESALQIASASYKDNKIKVEVNRMADIRVFGCENEYAQVILNILSNAKSVFVRRGIVSPKVIIDISEDGGKSKVTIKDNGGGIDERILPKIFTPFESGSGSSGVGLYMSKKILEKNGGTLEAKNWGEGAEFTIVL